MNSRDLKADLELCNKATPGPWRAGESFVITFHDEWICEVVGEYSMDCEDNMRFVAQAREGWPHAIERALEAEALVNELKSDSKTDDAVMEGQAKRIEELKTLVRELAKEQARYLRRKNNVK